MTAKKHPSPPGPLLDDGLRLWTSITSLYGLSPSELETLWQACQTADLIAALSEVLWSGGATVKGSAGQLKVSPLIPALSDQRRLMDSLLRSLNLPLPNVYWTWPGAVKNRVEAEVITAMAGDIAEDLFAWGGEASETKAESRSDWLDLAEPTDAELAMTAAAHDDLTGLSDAAQVERLCRVAHDDAATAWAWQWYLESVTRALLLKHAERVKWLAIVLAEEGTLSAKAVAVLASGPP